MKKGCFKVFIVVAFLIVFSGAVMAAEQAVNVNVNVNPTPTFAPTSSDTVFTLGIFSPIFGNATNKTVGEEYFTTKLTGINWTLGYTVRNYLGQGLPYNGGQVYFDYGTCVLIIPYLGFGYSHRIDGNLTINIGLPEGLSIGFKL